MGFIGAVANVTRVIWQTDKRTVQHAMLNRFINWFRGETEPEARPVAHVRRRTSALAAVHFEKREPRTEAARSPDHERPLDGQIDDLGPGKNVLVRKKYVRKDADAYDKLEILDNALDNEREIGGIDPYNSGQFDRSRHWDRPFRD